jgi:hypothetical protein
MDVIWGGVELTLIRRKQKYVRHERCHSHRTVCCPLNSAACHLNVCGVNLLEDKCLAKVTDCRLQNLKCDKISAGLCDFLLAV